MNDEPIKETPAQRNDRDGFMKMTLVALTANYWAHNTPIPPEQIVAKAMHLAELLWEELQRYRQRHE